MNFRKSLKLICLSLLGIVSFYTHAQRPDWEEISVAYTQLPSAPVEPDQTEYTLQVNILAAETREALKLERDKEISESKEQLKEDLKDHRDLAASGGFLTRLALSNSHPVLNVAEDQRYYPKARDERLVKNTIKVPGITWTENSDFIVEATFMGFEIVSINDIQSKKQESMGVFKQIQFVQPVLYGLRGKNEKIFWEYAISESDNSELNVDNTAVYASQELLDKYWHDNRSGFLAKLDEDSYRKYRNMLNDLLTDKIGFPTKNWELYILVPKGKEDYTNFEAALKLVQEGVVALRADDGKADDFFRQAISIWEKELSQADLQDKKSRINSRIAGSLHFSIAQIEFVLGEFADALKHVDEGLLLEDNRSFTERAKKFSELVKDSIQRLEINKKERMQFVTHKG